MGDCYLGCFSAVSLSAESSSPEVLPEDAESILGAPSSSSASSFERLLLYYRRSDLFLPPGASPGNVVVVCCTSSDYLCSVVRCIGTARSSYRAVRPW
jgi:hypothetical protein